MSRGVFRYGDASDGYDDLSGAGDHGFCQRPHKSHNGGDREGIGLKTNSMAVISRDNLASALSNVGLKKTLVALRTTNAYSINRLCLSKGKIELKRLGQFDDPSPRAIGRVGLPDTKLALDWHTMTFYGAWFDELKTIDIDFRIRKNIVALPRDTLLNQVQRDEKYGLVGSYYAVFSKILSVGKGIPMVLLDDSLIGLASFPVIIPTLSDKAFEQELGEIMQIYLKKELALDACSTVADTKLVKAGRGAPSS